MGEPRVCIFGVDEEGNAIRPVLPEGISEDYAKENNIGPFNEIEFDLAPPHRLKAPHLEDWWLNPKHKPKFIRKLSLDEQKDFLEKIKDNSVKDIFGAEIHESHYVNEREGNRSLGTVETKDVGSIDYSHKKEGKFNYRMRFLDDGIHYDLPVTDLLFRNYCDYLRVHERLEPKIISADLSYKLSNALVFLRIVDGRVDFPRNGRELSPPF